MLLIAVGGILYLSLKSRLLEDDVPREKLSSIINTDFQEVRPIISADGTRLYFSRRNHPENTGGSKDFQDIWFSDYKNGAWSTPLKLPEPINNKKTNTLCSITNDGSYALLLDSYKRVKTPLAQIRDSPAGWSAPDELVIRDFINLSSYYDFCYNQQLEVIISAIDDGHGSGEQDLHVSFKQKDGTYSKPKNLGKVINSRKSDFAPFLATDGKTLYFSSFGHEGFGGSDFYVCYRLDDSWLKWTTPKNLGQGINSANNENFLSVSSDFSYVYFESYPEGAEDKDIYRAPLPRQFHPENLKLKDSPSAPIAVSNVPESSSLKSYDPVIKSETATTRPSSTLPPPNNSTKTSSVASAKPVVKSKGELYQELNGLKREFGDLVAMQYISDGQAQLRILNNGYFDYNSYDLTPECKDKLNQISKLLLANAALEVQLEGHTDNWGTDMANQRLSYLRAQAAGHYLIDQGVSSSQVTVLSAGEDNPLASNDDEREGRELNRRVEITLTTTPSVLSDL